MDASQKITQKVSVSQELIESLKATMAGLPGFSAKIQERLGDPAATVTQVIEIILAGAIALDTSDVHLEGQETDAKLRVRLDGVLQDAMVLTRKSYDGLLSRIKLLSEMKLNISNKPQDGRFSILAGTDSVEIRASVLPTEYGDSVVMRILNPKSLISLDQAGLRKDLYDEFIKQIGRPNGMIIVTGPTGSGKTTTLYAFLKQIQNPEIKIITIEDPIEYHLQGISQTQVEPDKGYDFISGLRAIVRQDPDVILVGEIRDLETADIALQAALTGHLVFSTLHTNDAAGTIARLISLGAKPFNIGPALNMAVAQRLVRKVCPQCGVMEAPTPEELAEIKSLLDPAKELLAQKGIPLPEFGTEFKIPRAKGCAQCNNTGFHGRVGIYEAFIIDDEIQSYILGNPTIPGLKAMAQKKGMLTMYQDGLIKVAQGTTTLDEVGRVAEK
ncbi:MAG: GspE/PulE family protein [Candidatus Pacebacteria bacterium]|jgi:type II secretory ATPase GspE/PulE/Tfp pilus assembly ATPase PilB-like protein|nr:GspE/PulE family protein [Candidatus Paceibacterota bacterium]